MVADARTFASRTPFDLLVSSSALHWATPLGATFANLAGALRRGGRLVVALMVDGTLGELHALRRDVAPDKVPLARLLSSADVLDAVGRAGLRVDSSAEETIRVRYASGTEFLRALRAQGLTGGAVSSAARPLNRGELVRLAAGYDSRYRDPLGGVYASFEVLHLTAERS